MGIEFGFFDRRSIWAEVGAGNRTSVRQFHLLEQVDSTNLELLRLPRQEQHGCVVLADRQSSGRGRRGKTWHSPGGGNIYLSLGWRFDHAVSALAPLPLAAAVSLVRALRRAGLLSPGVKWPNDILVNGMKLGGVLVETRPLASGHTQAVVGVGVNVLMPREEPVAIEQAWTDVCTQLGGRIGPSFRDRLCGMILDELLGGMDRYAAEGFDPFLPDWRRMDLLQGRPICISGPGGTEYGRCEGISERGGLLLSTAQESGEPAVSEYFAGEVSVRATTPARG